MGGALLEQDLEIVDDLTPFQGQWVAVRAGHVVASDVDPARLLKDPRVDPSDRLVAVGTPGTTIDLL